MIKKWFKKIFQRNKKITEDTEYTTEFPVTEEQIQSYKEYLSKYTNGNENQKISK